MRILSFVLGAGLLAGSALPAPGEPALGQILAGRPRADGKLTPEEAVTIALRESPVVRGAAAEVEAAEARVTAARAERRPWGSVNTFLGGGSGANIVSGADPVQPRMLMTLPGERFFDQNVSLMAPIFTGGRLRAMVRQAQAQKGASEAELVAMQQEVALMVRLAYRAVQARESIVSVYQAMLTQNRERQRIDQIAYEQEKIPRFYTLRNAAEVANSEQMVTNARRDVEISLIELKTAMGVHLESRLELTVPLGFRPLHEVLAAYTPDPTEPAARQDGVMDAARFLQVAERNRPELTAASSRVQAGHEEVRAARGAYKPQVSAGVMGDFTKMRGESPFVGSTFVIVGSLPILDGGSRRAKVRIAEAERVRLEQDRHRTALRVGQEVATALQNLRAAAKNVEAARAALPSAVEDYRVALLRYTSGIGINVEALDALAAQVRAQNNEIQALYEYNTAQDQLARALGLITTSSNPGITPRRGSE